MPSSVNETKEPQTFEVTYPAKIHYTGQLKIIVRCWPLLVALSPNKRNLISHIPRYIYITYHVWNGTDQFVGIFFLSQFSIHFTNKFNIAWIWNNIFSNEFTNW